MCIVLCAHCVLCAYCTVYILYWACIILCVCILTSETCWALNTEIKKQVTSSWSLFIQPHILVRFESNFSYLVSCVKHSNIKFNENPSSGSRVAPCGRTDRHELTPTQGQKNGIERENTNTRNTGKYQTIYISQHRGHFPCITRLEQSTTLHTQTHTHSHTHTRTLTNTLTHAHSQTHPHTHSHSHSHTRTHPHTHTLTRTQTHTHSHTHTHTHPHTPSHTLTHTHTHTHTLTHPHPHTNSHTHTHIHTHRRSNFNDDDFAVNCKFTDQPYILLFGWNHAKCMHEFLRTSVRRTMVGLILVTAPCSVVLELTAEKLATNP